MAVLTQQAFNNGVITAIKTVAALGNRVYDSEATEATGGPAKPYVVVTFVGDYFNAANATMSGDYPTALIQVDLYCDTKLGTKAARTINEAIFTALHEVVLAASFTARCNSRGTAIGSNDNIRIMSSYSLQAILY